MALYKTEGIVLRSGELGEADRLITLFTQLNGKVRAVARGVRRTRSRLVGSTQLFTHGRYMLFEGKSLDTISQGEIAHAFLGLREDLSRMAYASYFAELLDRLTEEGEAHPPLFELVSGAFGLLCTAARPGDVARAYELKLMSLLGYRPVLESCVGCGGRLGDGTIRFSVEGGGILCPRCQDRDPASLPLTPAAWAGMRRLLERPLSEAPIFRPSLQVEIEMERILRAFLVCRLGGNLKSMEFLRSLSDMASLAPIEVKG